MLTCAKRLGVAALAGVTALVLAVPAAHAQRVPVVIPTTSTLPNRNYWVAPYQTLNQTAFNIRVLGNAYQQVPPWLYGYNPYPNPIISPYPPIIPPYPSPYSYGGGYGGYSGNTATLTTTPYGGGGYSYSGGSGGYSPYSGYGGYGYDPYSGYLTGTASVVNAQGQFLTSFGQANLLNEQVKQAKVDTRRRIWDEWKYEQANTPSIQDEQERLKALAYRRAMENPPLTEIWSSHSLNEILDKLVKDRGKVKNPPTVTIDEDVLKQINVTAEGKNGPNVALIKNIKTGAEIRWPVPLKGTAFDEQRNRLDKQIPEAVKVAVHGGDVDAGTIRAMSETVGAMQNRLTENVNILTPDQYVESKRFLNQLGYSIKALEKANASHYFNNTFAAKGKTVKELIDHMANGLYFAPPAPGEEAAYVALHNALVNYATSAQSQMTKDDR